PAALRALPLDCLAQQRLAPLAGDGGESKLVGTGREQHRNQASIEQLAQAARDQIEEALEFGLGRERVADLVEGLELLRPAGRGLVEPRVLDRDRGLAGEQLDELLVLGGEILTVSLLGQVEVAVGDASEMDRNSEKGVHRRVMRRKSDRAGIVRDPV